MLMLIMSGVTSCCAVPVISILRRRSTACAKAHNVTIIRIVVIAILFMVYTLLLNPDQCIWFNAKLCLLQVFSEAGGECVYQLRVVETIIVFNIKYYNRLVAYKIGVLLPEDVLMPLLHHK